MMLASKLFAAVKRPKVQVFGYVRFSADAGHYVKLTKADFIGWLIEHDGEEWIDARVDDSGDVFIN